MKDFALSELGPSHRVRLMQLLTWDHPQSPLAAISFGVRAVKLAQKRLALEVRKQASAPMRDDDLGLPDTGLSGLVASPQSGEINVAPP
ncbi:MAG: hypothetical protein ABI196_15190 [Bradyrhizobium sp.]